MTTIIQTLAPFMTRDTRRPGKNIGVWLCADSQSIITSIKEKHVDSTKHVFKDHNDIILQIKDAIESLAKQGIHIALYHVKGHQDDKNQELTPEAKLNVRVNDISTAYLSTLEAWAPSQRPIFFPSQQIGLTHQNNPIIAHIESTLCKEQMHGIVEDYFESRFGIHPYMHKKITWNSIGKVFKNKKNPYGIPSQKYFTVNSTLSPIATNGVHPKPTNAHYANMKKKHNSNYVMLNMI